MRLTRRSFVALFSAVLLIVGLAPGAFAASEDSLLSKLNAERSSRGLSSLASHWDLVDDAEVHSGVMMSQDRLHHNPNLGSVTSGWVSLGENVGVGPSVKSIHSAFMNSSAHRGNILGDFTHVGIGAVRQSENKLWVTVVFMKAAGAPTTTTTSTSTTTSVPTTTSAPTTSGPPSVVTTTTVVATTTLPPGTPPTTSPQPPGQEPGVGNPEPEPATPAAVVLLHSPRPD
ncbi:MAG: CAP domain-containing protein [bacterium]|nr:CAP domain-containing protein [bacterium]